MTSNSTNHGKQAVQTGRLALGLGFLGVIVAGLFIFSTPAQGADPTPSYTSPHDGMGSIETDTCATCHRVHRDESDTFVAQNTIPRSLACFTCHDGTGANSNIAGQFDAATLNDPTNREYYSHPANATGTGHVGGDIDEDGGLIIANEFEGVLNRHSDCVDCHNPHLTVTGSDSITSANGWTADGSLTGASVVSADWPVNPANSPTYSFVARATTDNFEYQLCLKCHSSFTQLRTNVGWARSKWYLDFGKLLNPNNTSFHPIAAAGKNTTTALANSLLGNVNDTYYAERITGLTVTSTISCGMCHGNPGAGTHATGNPNLLSYRYRSENLKLNTEAYDAGEFKSCFMCHSDQPFRSTTNSTYTNFSEHYEHMTTYKVGTDSTPTDGGTVNDEGNGRGYSLCVECHFESHSSGQPDSDQTVTGSHLVRFSPNVSANPDTDTLVYVAADGSTPGTCTLLCHGKKHTAATTNYTLP